MGINSGIVGSAGDGDAGGDGVQEMDDDVPGSLGARHGEDREEEGSEDHDNDIILVSSPPHKVIRCSVTLLSSSNRDIEAGSNWQHGHCFRQTEDDSLHVDSSCTVINTVYSCLTGSS